MGNAKNHKYTVELRVQSPDLDPDRVTEELGIYPSHSRKPGQRTSRSGQKSDGMWAYSGTAVGEAAQREWDSLEEGISKLIDDLALRLAALDRLKERHEIIWWCGHFQSSFDGGPSFSVSFLKKLVDFGVPLFLDNYFSEPGQVDSSDLIYWPRTSRL